MDSSTGGRALAAEPDSIVLPVLWRGRRLIALGLLIGGALGWLTGQVQPTSYMAQARLVLASSSNFSPLGEDRGGDPVRFVKNQISILTASQVLEGAVLLTAPNTSPRTIQLATKELSDSIDATASDNSDVITIQTSAPTAALAKARADAVATAYLNFTTQQVAAQAEQALQTTSDPTLRATIKTQAAIFGNGVAVFEPASLPVAPSAPKPVRNGLILAVFGAALATALLLLRRRRGISSARWRDAAADLGVRVLGVVPPVIPASRAISLATGAVEGSETQAFENILVSLDYVDLRPIEAVMVTGARAGAATTGAARELAIAAAGQGHRVALLTANQGSHQGERAGVGSLIVVHLERVGTRVVSSDSVYPIAQPGPGRKGRRLMGPGAREAIERLIAESDFVVVDVPPITSSPVAYAVAGMVDAVLLVVDDASSGEDVALAVERVSQAGSTLAGLIATLPDRRKIWRGWRAEHKEQVAVARGSVAPPRLRDDART